jgi:uncharacterized coiled-coil DUF342 family protein
MISSKDLNDNFKKCMRILQKDKEKAIIHFINLINKYLPIYKNLEIHKPLLSIFNFYPLPYEFQIDYLPEQHKIIHKNNIYYFMGKPGDRILFANRRLPYIDKDPIPFSFPITLQNKTKIIQSNTFYYEVEIINNRFRLPWENECLSIGYGSPSTNIFSQVGWTERSWGFHSDDGAYITKNDSILFTEPWTPNNIYGVGLTYLSKNTYHLFLTKNGVICNKEIKIECCDYMVPMIGLDLSMPVKINWGNEQFAFNLEKYIKANKIISFNNNFLKFNESDESYKLKPFKGILKNNIIYKNIITSPSNESVLFPNVILSKLFSLSDSELLKQITPFNYPIVKKYNDNEQTSNFIDQASDYIEQALNNIDQASNYNEQTSNYNEETSNYNEQTSNYNEETSNYNEQTTNQINNPILNPEESYEESDINNPILNPEESYEESDINNSILNPEKSYEESEINNSTSVTSTFKSIMEASLLSQSQQPMQQTFEQPMHQSFQQPMQQSFQQPIQQSFQQPMHQSFQQPTQNFFQHPTQQFFQHPFQYFFQYPSQEIYQYLIQQTIQSNYQTETSTVTNNNAFTNDISTLSEQAQYYQNISNQSTQFPNQASLYPNQASQYPNQASQYPNQASQYPNQASQYPNQATQFPNYYNAVNPFNQFYPYNQLLVSLYPVFFPLIISTNTNANNNDLSNNNVNNQ